MMTAVSTEALPAAVTSLVAALDDQRHERDQECPCSEHVGVDERHAQYVDAALEQRKQGIVEEEAAEQEKRDQTLSLEPGAPHHTVRQSVSTARVCRGFREWRRPA